LEKIPKLSVSFKESILPAMGFSSVAVEAGVVPMHSRILRGQFHRALGREMPDTAKPRILVADDERVIADSLAMILNQSGFDTRAVYSGEKAVELAVTFKPEMLIADVIMADLLEKARAQGHEFEILSKPVHPQDLLARLRD
jgi:PleD family two-component response regulator